MRKTKTLKTYNLRGVNRVEWQAANLHPSAEAGAPIKAWQLRVNGRVLLHAVAMTEIHEAVTSADRKLIGQALADYISRTP